MTGRFTAAVFLCAALGASQSPAPTADSILQSARQQAAPGHRIIFANFHASWCGWCKKLEAFVDSAQIQPIFERHLVKAYFTVEERDRKRNTPGGEQLMKKLGGLETGIPFYAFLDDRGEMVANSIRLREDGKPAGNSPGEANIGYPEKPEEVAWFMTMLKKAVPEISSEETGTLERCLRESASKH